MLELTNLTFGYEAAKPILSIASFKLPQGQNLLVRGPSGSGKTSLLFLLAGILTPTSGKVVVAGTDVASLFPAARDAWRGQTVGMVFQQPHLMAPLTVRQNLLVAPLMANQPAANDQADLLLSQLGLSDLADRKPDQLSQGQQQRVGIARALMNSPKVILADEPTSALDDDACVDTLAALLKGAKAVDAQLVVVSHDARIFKSFEKTLTLKGAAQ
jgi:ABC-type lipoprotein export system ATPase subunit